MAPRRRSPVAVELSIIDARRLALSAQGFGATRAVSKNRLRSVFDRVGVIQIDSVNVLARSQELALFARLGHHDRQSLGSAIERGRLFEYWVHEASVAPVDLHPYLRWRMQRPHPWLGNFYGQHKSLVERLYRRVRDDGPLKAADVSMRTGHKGSWWDWDDAKRALEYLFYAGRVTTRARDASFARVYDLTERVLPATILDLSTPSEFDARRELLRRAASHLGVATLRDLADYHRQKPRDVLAPLESLVEDGELRRAVVEGWTEPAYVPKRSIIPPDAMRGCELLSPFDSLVWNRERNERLFDFHYRIEIYTPRPKRRFGYYVLPVLCDERLVGRIDLKADRTQGVLRVEGSYVERGIRATTVAQPVAERLGEMAQWLGLARVTVARRGNLATALSGRVVRGSSPTTMPRRPLRVSRATGA